MESKLIGISFVSIWDSIMKLIVLVIVVVVVILLIDLIRRIKNERL